MKNPDEGVTAYIGVIGAGKDYRANKLVEAGAVRIDFKDELMNMCSDIAGYDIREDYDWFKDQIVGVRKPNNPLMAAMICSEMKEFRMRHPEVMTGRRLLTRMGTECMRTRDNDYWVKQFLLTAGKALINGKDITTADCRFLNEVATISTMSVPSRFIFCDFRSDRYNPSLDHKSERLAQALLSLGLKDGEEITAEHFDAAADILDEKIARKWRK